MIIRLYTYSYVFESASIRIESTVYGRNMRDAKKQAVAILAAKDDTFSLPEKWRKNPEKISKHVTVTRKYGHRTALFDTEKWRYVS